MSSYNINLFNEKIRVMNQTNSRQLTLSAAEARNLHTEIFALLERVEDLTTRSDLRSAQDDLISVEADGGQWS